MRKIAFLSFLLCVALFSQGAVNKSVTITAGTLASTLTPVELGSVTNLTITGSMDARDFQCIRDLMPSISDLNLSAASIVAYTGTSGTSFLTTNYLANEIPDFAFCRIFPTVYICPLHTVTLPVNLTSIGNIAFGYSALSTIIIPSSVVSIKGGAFAKSMLLSSVTLPNSLKSIDKTAFGYCQSLTSITLPSSLTTLADSVFKGCTSLTSLSIPNGITVIGNSLCRGCSSLNAVTLPNAVTSIGTAAFLGTKISTLTLPNTVSSIADSAFYNCTSLASIYANAVTPVDLSLSPSVFTGVNKSTCVLHVPNKTVYASSPVWKDFTNFINTSVDELGLINFSVYPSPSNGRFVVRLPKVDENNLIANLVDVQGRVVSTVKLTDGESQVDLTAEHLNGIFLLQLINDKGVIIGSKKLIVD
jgi:BspA type Leucine rich repeat region (6 copies)/Secretion system C-terminal sorting domain